MHEGRLRTGLRIAVSTAIGLSLALTANYLTLAQPQPGQTSPARDPDSAPPYPLEGETVSKPPAALAAPHTVACSESFGKDSSHLKLAMGFGFRNVTATDVEANDGTKVAASVIFPDDPQQRLEVWWRDATSHSGIYLIDITGQSGWAAPDGLRLGLTLAEVEKLNHKSFKLKGFDKNGVATTSDWGGGELASLAGGCNAGLSLRADPKVSAKIIGALSPNKEYASSNPQMRAAKPIVSEILIEYPTDAPATEAAPQPLTQQRASQDCWMEIEHGAKSLPLDKRAKLVDKCEGQDERRKIRPHLFALRLSTKARHGNPSRLVAASLGRNAPKTHSARGFFAAAHESAFGTKRTLPSSRTMSAFGDKADIANSPRHVCL